MLKMAMELETPARKIQMLVFGLVCVASMGTIGGFYTSGFINTDNTMELSKEYCTNLKALDPTAECTDDQNPYDVTYFFTGYGLLGGKPFGSFTDQSAADDLIKSALSDCGKNVPTTVISRGAALNTCYPEGSRWSIVWKLNGITCLMMAATYLLVFVIGAYNFHSRALGGCLGCCIGCVNFAALITTGVFRYNTLGKLAALSDGPSYYDTELERMTD